MGLVSSKCGGISSERTTSSGFPNWVVTNYTFREGAKLCFPREDKLVDEARIRNMHD